MYNVKLQNIIYTYGSLENLERNGTEWNGILNIPWKIKKPGMENQKTRNGKFKKPGMEYRKNILLISKMKQKTRRNRQSR